MLVSSANNTKLHRLVELQMSFMYSKNRSGPKTLPCGTPKVTGNLSEFSPKAVVPAEGIPPGESLQMISIRPFMEKLIVWRESPHKIIPLLDRSRGIENPPGELSNVTDTGMMSDTQCVKCELITVLFPNCLKLN